MTFIQAAPDITSKYIVKDFTNIVNIQMIIQITTDIMTKIFLQRTFSEIIQIAPEIVAKFFVKGHALHISS